MILSGTDWLVFSILSFHLHILNLQNNEAPSTLWCAWGKLWYRSRKLFWLCYVKVGGEVVSFLCRSANRKVVYPQTNFQLSAVSYWSETVACNQRDDGGFPGLGRIPKPCTIQCERADNKADALHRINTGSALCTVAWGVIAVLDAGELRA